MRAKEYAVLMAALSKEQALARLRQLMAHGMSLDEAIEAVRQDLD